MLMGWGRLLLNRGPSPPMPRPLHAAAGASPLDRQTIGAHRQIPTHATARGCLYYGGVNLTPLFVAAIAPARPAGPGDDRRVAAGGARP